MFFKYYSEPSIKPPGVMNKSYFNACIYPPGSSCDCIFVFFVNTHPHDVLNECITLRYVFSPDATSLEAELRSACVHTQSECSRRNNFTREKIWSRKLS